LVDRSEIEGVLGILAGMVGAAVSWAAGLGVLTILLSISLGALMTYLVGMKTQKNGWKRDAALRKVDDIYGPLYFELNRTYQSLTQPSDTVTYGALDPSQPNWESIWAGYKLLG